MTGCYEAVIGLSLSDDGYRLIEPHDNNG